jgi:hypothetical protein
LVVVVIAVAIGGLTVVMHQEGRASTIDIERSESQIRALELAETGLTRAALEVSSQTDSSNDGIGVVSGSYLGGTYATTCTVSSGVYTIISTGRAANATRRLEFAIRRVVPTTFGTGIISQGAINVSSNGTQTDSFDSSIGTYASQAIHTDASGSYAGTAGGLAGNVDITIGSAMIRGNATPGPGHTTTISNGGTVTGSTTPQSQALSIPDPPYSEFQSALLTNDNGKWVVSGGANVNYDPVKATFAVSGGGVVTFPPGIYFFSKFSISGNSTVRFTGLTIIYDVYSFDTTGGSIDNATGFASNLQVYAQPYVFPPIASPNRLNVSLSGGSTTALAMYAPEADVSISGGGDFAGGVVGGTVKLSGGTHFHYDTALASGVKTLARFEQLYWRESTPPLR